MWRHRRRHGRSLIGLSEQSSATSKNCLFPRDWMDGNELIDMWPYCESIESSEWMSDRFKMAAGGEWRSDGNQRAVHQLYSEKRKSLKRKKEGDDIVRVLKEAVP
jgi:hypothetical protein